MDFTTQKIVLGAAGASEPDAYYYFYSGSTQKFERISDLDINNDGDLYVGFSSGAASSIYASNYDAHDIIRIDKEGNPINWVVYDQYSDGSAAGRGLSVKNDGTVYSITRGRGRFELQRLNTSTPSVVSKIYPGFTTSSWFIDPNGVYQHGTDVYCVGSIRDTSNAYVHTVVKLNQFNSIQWSKHVYVGTAFPTANVFTSDQNSNGDILLKTLSNTGNRPKLLTKINTSGNLVAGSYFQTDEYGSDKAVIDNNGDYYLLTRATESLYSPSYTYFYNGILTKFNGSTGAVIWTKELRRYTSSQNTGLNVTNSSFDVSDDGTIHLITNINGYSNSNEFMYYRINSSGSGIYARKITQSLSSSIYSPKIKALGKNIYITLSEFGSSSGKLLVIKLPDSGDITGSFNQVTISNVGFYHTIQNVGSNYNSPTPSGGTSSYSIYNASYGAYSTQDSSISSQSASILNRYGSPINSSTYSNYTLPL